MKHSFASAVAATAVLALAACASDDGDSHAAKLYCPAVAVLQQTNELNAFLPSRDDVPGQITEAQITGVAGSCDFGGQKGIVRVTFRVGFTATNGPANDSKTLVLPYFVSTVDGERIVSKSLYTIPVSFDGNVASGAATSEALHVDLPNEPRTAREQVLVGFQLSREQMAYAVAHPAP